MSISSNVLSIFTGRSIGMVSGIVFTIVVPKMVGPVGMGEYAYWFAVYTIMCSIVNFGSDAVMQRFIPQLVKENSGSIKGLLAGALLFKSIIFIISFIIGSYIFKQQITYFAIIATGVFITSISFIPMNTFYGFQKMMVFSLSPPIGAICRLILILILFSVFGNIGIIFAVAFFSLPYFIFSLPCFIQILIKLPSKTSFDFPNIINYGIFVSLSSVIINLIFKALIIIAQKFDDNMEFVGYLGFASIVVLQTILVIPGALISGMFPAVIEATKIKHDSKYLRKLYSEVLRYCSLVLTFLIIGAIIFSRPVIVLIIDKSFLPSLSLIYALLPAALFFNLMLINQHFMQVLDKNRIIPLYYMFGLLIFIFAGSLLMSCYGILSLCITLSIVLCIMCGLTLYSVRSLFEFNKEILLLFRIIVMAAIIYLMSLNIIINSLSAILVYGILFFIFFIVLSFLFKLLSVKDYYRVLNAIKVR